jgi:hypothetical protein
VSLVVTRELRNCSLVLVDFIVPEASDSFRFEPTPLPLVRRLSLRSNVTKGALRGHKICSLDHPPGIRSSLEPEQTRARGLPRVVETGATPVLRSRTRARDLPGAQLGLVRFAQNQAIDQSLNPC